MPAEALSALGSRLKRLPPWFAWYGWWKVRLDPVYGLILGELGEDGRSAVDLGAGMGLFEALLVQRPGGVASVLAVERDKKKAAVARRLLHGEPGVRVVEGDARSVELGAPGAILLVDVLHYLTEAEQLDLLGRCASSLAPGGALFVREIDGDGRRGALARAIERLAVLLKWNHGERVHPLPARRIKAHLEAAGLALTVHPAGRGPFAGNVLLVARKAGRPRGSEDAPEPP